jgi:hypothetical protein
MKQKPVLQSFIGPRQAACIRSLMRGEEGEWFRAKIQELQALVDSMPVTYDTEPQDETQTAAPAVARLHYFGGSDVDAWIVELDKGAADDTPEDYQSQAWGKVDLGCGAELGYVSIPELLNAGLELDLHWQPRPVSECGKE